jgi:uncharacterized membrane protein
MVPFSSYWELSYDRTPGGYSVYGRLDRAHRAFPLVLGAATLIGVALLLAWDFNPGAFPEKAHDALGAFPLAMIAIAYLVYQTVRRPTATEFVKALMLAGAFLFWAANQLWPDRPQATLFNDIAIALFVIDVFLVMVGWPATSPDESFAETYVDEVKRS